jgi:hypothetical protein
MLLYLLLVLAIVYVFVEYIQLNRIANPKDRLQIFKHYPQQHKPLANLSPAASQIILSQNATLTPKIIYGIVMDWALKEVVTINPIDANFGIKDGEIDDFIVFKKDNPDKIKSLKSWEKDLYQELFTNKNSFQVTDLIMPNNNLSSSDKEILAKHWEISNRYWKVPQKIIEEELTTMTLTKKQLTLKNIIWLIIPFLQVPLFLPLFFASIALNPNGLIMALSFILIFMSAPLFCLISIVTIFRVIINKNTTGIYLNQDGLGVKKYLLGLIKYIDTAEKERLIFHAKDKSLSEIDLLPYAVTFGIIKPLIDFDTEPRIIDKSEYRNPSVLNLKMIMIFIVCFIIWIFFSIVWGSILNKVGSII